MVVAAAVVGGFGWSLALAGSQRTGGESFVRFQAAVVALVLVAAASGGVVFIGGARPAAGLHFLYAVVAIALIPLARSFFGQGSPRRTGTFLVVAFGVLGAVVWRLFSTG